MTAEQTKQYTEQMAVITAVLLLTAVVVIKCTSGMCYVEVSCLVINLEHMDCTWKQDCRLQLNYTFQSRLGSRPPFRDCPQYLREGGYNVGCRLPYKINDKFSSLHTRLSGDNNVTKEQTIQMKERVKLKPPLNLSVVVNSTNLELWLYWNTSTKSTCTESEVRYRKQDDQWHSAIIQMSATSHSIPFIFQNHQYELQVRTRVSHFCGESMFWSDWSAPIFYHVPGKRNATARIADLHALIYLASVGLGWLWPQWML
uniref:Cytokine receptor common subunit gamma-like n=1 Tax=Paramormyrops kingsleyae TaxID=1676925 RepID=A0A3B3QDK4_9TELE|nr:cytokine receptor common subunit gamma-like [Paramormyrops kingsleyae]